MPARRAPRLRPVRWAPLTLERLIADIRDRHTRDAAIPERQEFAITAAPKPRMTQADRWLKRPPVLRYRAFCDEIRLKGAKLPSRYRATFVLPMPPSWPDDWKQAMDGQPHLLKPDASNLCKALEDALEAHDESLHAIGAEKRWGREGRIIIEKLS